VDRKIKKWIILDGEKCIGCGVCQQVCPVNQNQHLTDRYGQNRIPPILFQNGNQVIEMGGICTQCTNAPCMHFCPMRVITRDEKTGAICVKKEFCIGCGMCLTACPNDAIFLDRERGKAIKCELCGGNPLCVANCSVNALQLFSVT
jgi:Fe-S-cluster-containing hydrogenase component 2